MRLSINLDTLQFIAPINPAVVITTATMRRDDVLPLEVSFYRGGFYVELATGATGAVQLNLSGTYGGSGLAADSSFAKTGTGPDARYTFDLDLSEAAMDTAFSADPDDITGLLEIKVVEGDYTYRTEPLTVTIQNAVMAS